VAKKALMGISIKNQADLEKALQQLEELNAEIAPLQAQAVMLKKAATEYAVKKRISVVQLDGVYYRKIVRTNRAWDNEILRKILKRIKVDGKPLWNKVTKRVIDPDKLAEAVAVGWVTEKKLDEAYVETEQAPFLQRYTGEAD